MYANVVDGWSARCVQIVRFLLFPGLLLYSFFFTNGLKSVNIFNKYNKIEHNDQYSWSFIIV